jgi:hypothetical protein
MICIVFAGAGGGADTVSVLCGAGGGLTVQPAAHNATAIMVPATARTRRGVVGTRLE